MITSELRAWIFERDGYACRICGGPVVAGQPQLAHRIPKTVANLRRFGIEVIDHPLNLWTTCTLRCNSAALVHFREVDELAAEIKDRIIEEAR